MTKLITTLFFGACLSTFAAEASPILVCEGVGRPDLEKIEVFESADSNKVITYDAQGLTSELTIAPAIGGFFEATIPLPAYENQQRSLQWRHTGWVVNIRAENDHDRIAVDCQE